MKKLFTLIVLIACAGLHAQVGIGTTNPDGSAALDVTATDKGMLVPRLTTAQRVAISSPATGLLVYDTTAKGFWFYNGTAWTDLSSGSGAVGWALDGNVGTDPSTNFVGTIDNVPLNFRVNNDRVGHIGTGGSGSVFFGNLSGIANDVSQGAVRNVGIGSSVLYSNTSGYLNIGIGDRALNKNTSGSLNTAVGDMALYNNTTGGNNTAYGSKALVSNTVGNYNFAGGFQALYSNTEGNRNVAVGHATLFDNTSGSYNVAIGSSSLRSNTIGEGNIAAGNSALNKNTEGSNSVAIGNNSLYNNTTGRHNTAVGQRALFSNTTSNFNTAIGDRALTRNTIGSLSTAIGSQALFDNTTGVRNTAVGYQALQHNETGDFNTAIGYNAGPTSTNLSNTTAIGYNVEVDASNKVRIGNTSVTVIEGQVAWTNPSDARFKYNVKNNVPGLEFITKLKPATYYFDNEKLEKFTETGELDESWTETEGMVLKTGFLAQEVEQAAQEVGYDFDGINKPQNDRDKYTLAYSTFVVPLVKAVQEQQQIIDSLNEKINAMEAKLEAITQQIEASSAAPAPSVLVSN